MLLLGLGATLALPAAPWITSAGHPAEGVLAPHLEKAALQIQPLFQDERFPNVAVAGDGTILATWGRTGVRLRRSQDGGATWEEPVVIARPGWQTGGLTVDETSGDILAFIESDHPPADISIYRSRDQGRTWHRQKTDIGRDSRGNLHSLHMNEHGITLRRGPHKGRLLRPSRWYAGKNERARWPRHYTSAIYSDDGGRSWRASEPFPAFGTGEAALVQLSDGRIYYNSRRHWAPEGENPRRRWVAWSTDGGVSWQDLTASPVLPDGPQDSDYGCMAGLTRLPVLDRDILLYSNCDSHRGRNHGTVWASFDGGKTWPLKRLVFDGAFAYSSMHAGRPHTASEGWVYLQFEGGPAGGCSMARFNLAWVLEGDPTGDGEVPGWVRD